MARQIHLVVIDPQNSFCKVVPQSEQQVLHDGELCVTGAWDDMNRLSALVDRLGKKLDDIHVTLDSHHPLHIAHQIWYRDSKGNLPDPFTCMREQNGVIIGSKFDANGNAYDVGEFTCFKPSVHKKTLEYLKSLAAAKRYPHLIWPTHCLIGTAGHNVVPQLMESLLKWVRAQGDATVDFVTKGSNPYVEHFSAVRAEVIDPGDPSTQLNSGFINTLVQADEVLFAGEAGSHCLANTVRDIADSFADDSFIKKCVLLTDATSPVPGFESYQTTFVADMTKRGMKTATTVDYLA
jgi:nicotinamidase-related amidase